MQQKVREWVGDGDPGQEYILRGGNEVKHLSPCHSLPWTTSANLHQNQLFICFKNTVFTRLVTDERTDKRITQCQAPFMTLRRVAFLVFLDVDREVYSFCYQLASDIKTDFINSGV